jgi:hypothetical protein
MDRSQKRSRKHMLQYREKEKKKALRRLQNGTKEVSNDMVVEAIVRSSIDRLQSLLAIKKKPRPKNPHHDAKPNIHEIPCFVRATTEIPWLDCSDKYSRQIDLTQELNSFARYVSVSMLYCFIFMT